jgi:hypothetical protein
VFGATTSAAPVVSAIVLLDSKMSRLSAEAEAKQLRIVLLRHDGVDTESVSIAVARSKA